MFPLILHIFLQISSILGLISEYVFVDATIAPWKWQEGSSMEKVCWFYSLHPLDCFSI